MKLKPSIAWPLFVAGILLVSLSVCTLTVIASLSDKSHAIETDYYERAVRWDETARERDESAELGWTSDVSVVASGTRGEIRITLRDASGAPVRDASVRVEAFHHARRGDATVMHLRSDGEGVYTGEVEPAAAGLWQVRVRAASPGGIHVATHDVHSAEGSP